jgi:hypothetical protein
LIRNTLLAHLLGDLPVVLWWQGQLDDAFEPGLFQNTDRLIIDSTGWPCDMRAGQMELIMAARAGMARPFSLHDIAWTRTYQFRIALAALFDHPHAVQALPGICRAEVVVGSGQAATGQLLVAWIARTLGWRPRSRAGASWEFTTPGGPPVPVAIREDAAAAPLACIRLEHPLGRVEVNRAAGNSHLQAQIHDGSSLPPLVLPADPDATGDLVTTLLSRGGKNSLYTSILPVFLEMSALQAGEG